MASKWYCGVPESACRGSAVPTNQALLRKMINKLHGTPSEAFACHRQWLISQGYKPRTNRRELLSPDGSIRSLTRPSKFGLRMVFVKDKTRYHNHRIPWVS